MGIIYKNGIPYGNQPSTDAVAMIEPSEEATATSAHAYAVGEHFIYNDILYRATAAIAIGDTITPGTNCVATNVMTEVEAGGGGGGGPEKLNSTQAADAYDPTATYAVGDKVSYAGNVYSCISAISTPEAWDSTHWDQVYPIQDQVDDVRNTLSHKADVIYDTASGDIASFPDGADGLPVKDLTVAIEPVQSGTDDPSPTNVRPISGWTGANVSKTGKNLISENGPVSVSASQNIKYFNVKGGESYTISMLLSRISGVTISNNTINAYGLFEYDQNNNLIYSQGNHGKSLPSGSVNVPYSDTFTTDPKTAKIGINIGNNNGDSNVNTIKDKIQVEVGSTATSFESYIAPVTIPISWQSSAGTVYGGTLDVTSGVLTVTHKTWVSNGTEAWTFNGNGGYYTNSHYGYDSLIGSSNGYCNYFKYAWNFYQTNGIVAYTNRIQISKSPFASVSDLVAAFDETPLVMVYPLATPQTYQLDPVTVTTLLGQNNIWADCGPSTVEYPADTKLYIDKKLAALVAALS